MQLAQVLSSPGIRESTLVAAGDRLHAVWSSLELFRLDVDSLQAGLGALLIVGVAVTPGFFGQGDIKRCWQQPPFVLPDLSSKGADLPLGKGHNV